MALRAVGRLKDITAQTAKIFANRSYSGEFHFPKNESNEVIHRVEPEEKRIHTGQEWNKGDYRLTRFMETPKQINEQFAIDLIAEQPPIAVNERVTSCDGGGGALGHPKVYINLDQEGNHACGYCGLRFFKAHENGH